MIHTSGNRFLEVYTLYLFADTSDNDLRSLLGFWWETWVFLCNNILFLWQNPTNHLTDILKVSACSGYVSVMICFDCVLNHRLWPAFLPFFIDKSFEQLFLHYGKHYFPKPCWSWSLFFFLHQLFTFHPVSYRLSIYF